MQASVLVAEPRGIIPSPPLKRLVEAFRHFRERIPQQDLVGLVSGSRIAFDDVADYCVFHDHHYVRNLIHRVAHVEIFCMCWRSGQRSPIHDHNQSNCVVQVLQGIMTNIDFKLLPSGYIRPVGSDEYSAGAIEARSDADIHQVANLQPFARDLVTLHVYSPPLARMNVFSAEKPCAPRHYYPVDYGFDGEGI
jgi:cysteine dioxygenase